MPIGTSNRDIKYECTNCGREVGKHNLKVKRVQFSVMGKNGKIERTRVVAWLCMVPQADGSLSCLDADADYNRPSRFAAPGLRDVIK